MARPPHKSIKTPKGRLVKQKKAGNDNAPGQVPDEITRTRMKRVFPLLHKLLNNSHENLAAAEELLRDSASHLYDNGVVHSGPDDLAVRVNEVRASLHELINHFKKSNEQ